MSALKDYLPKQVQSEKKIGKIFKRNIGNWEVLLHAFLPHAGPEVPTKVFDEQTVTADDDFVYTAAFEMYKDSYARIDGIEQKGFNLLTYISAVSAIPVYYLSKDITGGYRFVVILALAVLALAIIISLRCLSIKSQKRLFIDGLFMYDPQISPVAKSKKAIIAELLNSAVLNQGIADNTADLLKATRILLSIGIIMTIISSVFYLKTGNAENKKGAVTKISFADSTIIHKLANEKGRFALDSQVKILRHDILKLKATQDSIGRIIKTPFTKADNTKEKRN